MSLVRPAFVLAALALAVGGSAQPYGIESRVPNTTLLITSLPSDDPGTMQLERAFAPLSFSNPVLMVEAPDDSGRLFVVEKGGRIWTFPNREGLTAGDKQLFLDVSTRTTTSSEMGLLGLAFAPDYAQSGVFYVYHCPSGSPLRSRVSRYVNLDPDGIAVDSSTNGETVILEVNQPADNHNGGWIGFGPDGMLYVSLGDGGGANDTFGNGQNTTTLLGSILRIDVQGTPDDGLNYAIPHDNPFYNGGPAGASTRKEIWVYGVRNPWRCSFDMVTGELYMADVGQGCWEEVDLVSRGLNYGWPRMEGNKCFQAGASCTTTISCSTSGLTRPITVYGRELGASITGGYVSYASRVPSLYGTYIYGDYVSGRIWGLKYVEGVLSGPDILVDSAGFNVSGFGQTSDGDVYVMNYGSGTIHRLVPQSAPTGDSFPTRLSDIPALLAAGRGEDLSEQGIFPYRPSALLWSDNVLKDRVIAMPGTSQAIFHPADALELPDGTVVLKNFAIALDERTPETSRKRIETRMLYRHEGVWHPYTYEWNEDETDALLLPGGGKYRPFTITYADGSVHEYEWYYPSRSQCLMCHTAAAGRLLGVTAPYLNHEFLYPDSGVTDNQLRTLDHIGFFTEPLPASPGELTRVPDYHDVNDGTVGERARAYLASNCSYCHRPGGGTPVDMDLRWETPDALTNTFNVTPNNNAVNYPDPKIIYPSRVYQSILHGRMSSREPFEQMPPLGTSRVDTFGTDLIREWIQTLPPPAGPAGWVVQ